MPTTDQPNVAAHRMAAFARTRDPRALWPELDDGAFWAARATLEAAARSVLADRRAVLAPRDDRELYALGIAAFTSGMGPLIGRWSEEGRVEIQGLAGERLFAEHLAHSRIRAERIEYGVLAAIDAMVRRGVTPTLLKGFHVARVYAEEPGVRPMADADLLIDPDDVDDAERALVGAAFRAITPVPTRPPYKREWMAPDIEPATMSIERVDARSPWRLELHASFDRDFPGALCARLDWLRLCQTAFHLHGRKVQVPAQPLLLLSLAAQLSSELDSMRLMRTIDLVRVIRADVARGALQWAAVLDAFAECRCARFVYPALLMADSLSPGTIPQAVLAASRADANPRLRAAADRLTPGGGWMDRRDLTSMFMWANTAPELLQTFVVTLARSAVPKPGNSRTAWPAMLRRLARGSVTLRPPDERVPAATAPARSRA